MVFSLLPSSKPVICAWSLNLSNTCTLSMASAGRFLVAILGSLPKFFSVYHYLLYFFTLCFYSSVPVHFNAGQFFQKVFHIRIGLGFKGAGIVLDGITNKSYGEDSPVTTTSLSSLLLSAMLIFPMSIFLCSSSIVKKVIAL